MMILAIAAIALVQATAGNYGELASAWPPRMLDSTAWPLVVQQWRREHLSR